MPNEEWISPKGGERIVDNFVEVRNLFKTFPGDVKAVNDVSFTVPKGKFLTLLGPSGCGKTTTLRCMAGLEKAETGEIIVDGEFYYSAERKITLPPHKRNIGMVFQSYAVWPHMNVFDNIAYGLRMKKVDKEEIKKKVKGVVALVGLEGLEERGVTKLSGGQQQRVALARALVYNPKLLLFDEPLSNLDAKLRERMRLELIKLQREIGITSIYVTHDQAEAMVISDEIIVMRDGKIEQIGNAGSIYNRPKSKFVADFIGIANFLDGEVIEKRSRGSKFGLVEISNGGNRFSVKSIISENMHAGEKVVIFFRPEKTEVKRVKSNQEGKEVNTFEGKISTLVYLGNFIDCRVMIGDKEIRAQIPDIKDLNENDEVLIEIAAENCVCLKKEY